jgi:hypothetical protein
MDVLSSLKIHYIYMEGYLEFYDICLSCVWCSLSFLLFACSWIHECLVWNLFVERCIHIRVTSPHGVHRGIRWRRRVIGVR